MKPDQPSHDPLRTSEHTSLSLTSSHQEDGKRAPQDITPAGRKSMQESMPQEYSTWPISRPGPLVSLPRPGSKPVNTLRSEQLAEPGYNQETGAPSTDNPLRYLTDEELKERTDNDQYTIAQERMYEDEVITVQQGHQIKLSHVRTIEDVLQYPVFPLTFHTLSTCIKATGLEYLLQGHKPMTLFAPPDVAFKPLRRGNIFDLLKNVSALKKLIEYHLVPLKLTTSELQHLAATSSLPPVQDASQAEERQYLQLPTVSGQVVTVSLSGEMLVEGVRVLQSDVEADNGVMHIIERVLWPPDMDRASFGIRSPLKRQSGDTT